MSSQNQLETRELSLKNRRKKKETRKERERERGGGRGKEKGRGGGKIASLGYNTLPKNSQDPRTV